MRADGLEHGDLVDRGDDRCMAAPRGAHQRRSHQQYVHRPTLSPGNTLPSETPPPPPSLTPYPPSFPLMVPDLPFKDAVCTDMRRAPTYPLTLCRSL